MSAEPTNAPPDDDMSDDARMNARSGKEVSIIVRAMNRLSDRRDLVVWQGDPVTPGPRLRFAASAASGRDEELRSLRTELLMRSGARRNKGALFAVLGSGSGEGRSQLCGELAIAFAQLSGRTLLVDADLRNPTLSTMFIGARADLGLSEVLLGLSKSMPLHPVVGSPNLALLTAGTRPANPVDLLSGGQFERFIREWSRTYDYVVIDTPPSKQFSDGVVIANAAHNVILVARRNQTSFDDVKELQRRLNATQARIIGAVLNDF